MTTKQGQARLIAVIAAPIALAQLSQMAMGVTDTLMLGGIGPEALAAGGLGAQIFFSILYPLQAIMTGVSVLAARAMGAGTPEEIPPVFSVGLLLGAITGVIVALPCWYAQPVLLWAGLPPGLAADCSLYLRCIMLGIPGAVFGLGLLKSLLPALGAQGLLLMISPGLFLLNAGLNWWLIHGGLGVPALGLRGSAYASAASLSVMCAALFLLARRRADLAHALRPVRIHPDLLRRMLAIGIPVSIQLYSEAGMFLLTGITAGALGATALAAHNVALNVASISFMVPWAIGQAAGVQVAGHLGAGAPAMARRAGLTGIAMAMGFMALSGACLYLLAPHLAPLYLGAAAPAAALGLTTSLVRIAAAFQLADGLQVVAAFCLRALLDSRAAMVIALAGYWGVGFLGGRALAFWGGMGVQGLWLGLLAGLGSAGLALLARFLWRSHASRL